MSLEAGTRKGMLLHYLPNASPELFDNVTVCMLRFLGH